MAGAPTPAIASAPGPRMAAWAGRLPSSRAAAWAGLSARGWEIALVGALLGAALLLRYPNLWTDPRITDEWQENLVALQIARGEELPLTNWDAYDGALWNYLVAAGYLLLGQWLWVPRVVALVVGTLTVLPTYLLGRELGGRRPALLAGLLMATSPIHIVANSHVAWSNCSTPLFATTGCWLLVAAVRRGSGIRLGLAGLAFGAAFQTHPTALALVPGALAYLVIRGRALLRPRWLTLAATLFVVGCLNLLVSLPAFIKEAQVNQERKDRAVSPGLSRYASNLGNLGLMLVRLPSGVAPDTDDWRSALRHPLFWVYAAAIGGGAVVAARRREPLALCLVASMAVLFPLVYPASHIPVPDGRYAMPLLPPLYASLAFALLGATRVSEPARPSDYARSGVGAVAWLFRPGNAAAPLVGLALAVLPLTSLSSYYASQASKRAVYSPVWETMLELEVRVPKRTRIVLDSKIRSMLGDENGRRGTDVVQRSVGLNARYRKLLAGNQLERGALANRQAVYVLSCPVYEIARRDLGIVPLSGDQPERCDVLRAARYP